jgi:hypothetical protein
MRVRARSVSLSGSRLLSFSALSSSHPIANQQKKKKKKNVCCWRKRGHYFLKSDSWEAPRPPPIRRVRIVVTKGLHHLCGLAQKAEKVVLIEKKGFITAFREILAPSREIFDDHDNRHLRQRVGPICQRTSGFQEAAHGHQPANF